MWVSVGRPTRVRSMLADLRVRTGGDCSGEVLTSDLQTEPHLERRDIPNPVAIAVSGTRVAFARIRSDGKKTWRPMHLALVPTRPYFGTFGTKSVTILTGDVDTGSPRDYSGVSVQLGVAAAKNAGHRSCFATAPGLFEYPGDASQWNAAQQIGYQWLQDHRHVPTVYAPLSDAIVKMSVRGMIPDRSALDAGARVQGGRAVFTCTGNVPEVSDQKGDDFATERELATRSNCSSVQRFAASDAVDDLNRRIFLAGLLAAAGLSMLLEALVLGRTEPT
jgi:hypothetical protein